MGLKLEKPLNTYIDHTLLRPDATTQDFATFLHEAEKYKFASVCVAPYMAFPMQELKNILKTPVRVGTVVGFPHGNIPLLFKVQQVDYFLSHGVREIDFVINVSELKSQNFAYIIKEVRTLGDLCKQAGAVSKCIIEACLLTQDEKETMFHYIHDFSNIDYIKTSTGFSTGGASLEDVRLFKSMRSYGRPLIKAAGGIRTLEQALGFIEAGANRLGTSNSVRIMEDFFEYERNSNT